MPAPAVADESPRVSRHFKNISLVATATMVSRVLGLGRDMLVTAVFGIEAIASAFYTAFTLPNLFRRLLGEGALTAAFVPTLNEEIQRRGREGAFALVNQVGSWLLLASGAVVATGMAGLWIFGRVGPVHVPAGVEGDTWTRWIAAADLGVVLFPYLVFVSLAAAFSAALQTLNRFLEPALSPIWLNLAMIGLLAGGAFGGWGVDQRGTMLWLCAGALLGGFLQMVVPAAALMRQGWRPRADFGRSEPLRQIARLMGPTVLGSAVYLINISISRFIGLSLNDSAVAALNLATRLMELPIGVFTVAVSTVVFPLISRHAAAGDRAQLAAAYHKGVRLILAVNLPAAAGLAILAEPIVRVLFQRGAFDGGDTLALGPVLLTYALGLPFLAWTNIVLRAFYAQKDTVTPVRAAILSLLVNIVGSILLMKPFGTVGLAAAGNLATVLQLIYLQTRLRRLDGRLGVRPVWADLVKVVIASTLMSALVWTLWRSGVTWAAQRVWAEALLLAAVIGAGAVVCGGALWFLRIEGREDLVAMLRRRGARRSEGA